MAKASRPEVREYWKSLFAYEGSFFFRSIRHFYFFRLGVHPVPGNLYLSDTHLRIDRDDTVGKKRKILFFYSRLFHHSDFIGMVRPVVFGTSFFGPLCAGRAVRRRLGGTAGLGGMRPRPSLRGRRIGLRNGWGRINRSLNGATKICPKERPCCATVFCRVE